LYISSAEEENYDPRPIESEGGNQMAEQKNMADVSVALDG